MSRPIIYVSITGLVLKRPWHLIQFYRHAIPSLRQARRAPGNLRADVAKIDGVYHTLSLWESRVAMRAFLYRGAHRHAIKAFGAIADGKTFGFETEDVPSWSEAHALWLDHGKDYGSPAQAA